MPAKIPVQVTLPRDQVDEMDALVESGDYGSRREVIMAALRLLQERA